jgi:hypothetical protein
MEGVKADPPAPRLRADENAEMERMRCGVYIHFPASISTRTRSASCLAVGRNGVKAEILKADPPTPRLRADENAEMKKVGSAE